MKTGCLLQLVEKWLQLSMVDFDFLSAGFTGQMVVSMGDDFVLQPPMGGTCGANEAAVAQKVEIAVDGWLSCARQAGVQILENFGRREMPARVVQYVQNSHPLLRHAKAAFTNLVGDMDRGTGHVLIVTYCNKKFTYFMIFLADYQ